ncbi:hypothetical protein J40TS1_26690 [Paenibacillus montaniterrae]|uniref:Uncharacterized protein n=1 Tax=Paenibacillus montaniterrae TaxID=429341 RepID=A0A919YM83_9BACL|nr:hypothetical protein J40TS1_26690 [Paenibacillus montaniterrae]
MARLWGSAANDARIFHDLPVCSQQTASCRTEKGRGRVEGRFSVQKAIDFALKRWMSTKKKGDANGQLSLTFYIPLAY